MAGSSEDISPEMRYGFGRWRPASLQCMNVVPVLVGFGSIGICFMFMVVTGLLGVVLSSIERRFDLTSSQGGWISAGYDIGSVVVLLALSYIGSRLHRPYSMAGGLLIISVGCVLFFLPQFLTPEYLPESGALADSLCRDRSNDTPSGGDTSDQSYSNYLPMFIVARVLFGVGSTPLLILGIGYLEDNTAPHKFSFYVGIIYAMGVIGPALGILGGGLMLSLFTDFYSVSDDDLGGISPGDPRWVGAWWLPFVVGCGLCVLIAIPLAGYPEDMPGSAEIRAAKISEAHNICDDEVMGRTTTVDYARNCAEVPHHLKTLFTNPTYVMLTLFVSCDIFIIAGFATFGPKYVENQFSVTPGQAGGLFGVSLLPAGAGGSLLGGFIIRRMKLTCSQIMRGELALSVTIIILIFAFFLTCDNLDFAGVTVPYQHNSSSEELNISDACNIGCMCDEISFDPVCSHENVRYFTPCHAGCTDLREVDDDVTEYYNCSCVSPPGDQDQPWATTHACSVADCGAYLAVFMIVFFFEVVMVFMCNSMNLSATIRSVPSAQRAMAVGLQWILIRLIGSLPGPVVFGVAFDQACILWDKKGSCLYYNNWHMALYIFVVCGGIKLGSVIFMALGLGLYKPPAFTDQVKENPDKAQVVQEDKAQVVQENKAPALQDNLTHNIQEDKELILQVYKTEVIHSCTAHTTDQKLELNWNKVKTEDQNIQSRDDIAKTLINSSKMQTSNVCGANHDDIINEEMTRL